ncbi:hypothetical protein EVAR_57648_1 [Eumeta japonica]|uniref:Uncharacterized protein n=1 Tax=Eumeta variegata TaxID=151549 RepID=A0A4C1ZBP7_EUMVA|nr:hypothetical protein EVAR_57648_1 [Eumeta japonica]
MSSAARNGKVDYDAMRPRRDFSTRLFAPHRELLVPLGPAGLKRECRLRSLISDPKLVTNFGEHEAAPDTQQNATLPIIKPLVPRALCTRKFRREDEASGCAAAACVNIQRHLFPQYIIADALRRG